MSSRVTIPEEFFDRTSDKLLCQPEPQYLYAQFFLSAVGADLPIPDGMGVSGREVRPGAGLADYAAADRDRLEMATALPESLMAVTVDFDGEPGNTLRINRPLFSNTTYTQASRLVPVGSSISTTPISVQSEQTSLTLLRFAGPYDATNSRPAPYALENFDSSMGVHKMTKIYGTHMTRDYHRFLDAVHVTLGDLAATVVYPDGMTADNDATIAGSFPMTMEQVSRTEQTMDDANLPTLPDGSRVLLLSPYQWKQLKHDPEYMAQSAFHKEFNLLFPNYVGSVGKFHVFKSTTLSKPANSSTVPVHRGQAIAPGAFMGGMGKAPRVASATDDNYGETAKVIWLSYLAFGLADNSFVVSVRSA